MEACELTILMPCLNEVETLTACIQKAKAFLSQENVHGEILIADNGSVDGSQQLAESLGARVIAVETRGYGAALKSGITQALGRYVIMGDADDSYNFRDLMPFLQRLRAGDDLVMGNRFQGGIQAGAMPFLNRYLGNPVLSFLGRLWFKNQIGDFHCGLRGFHRERITQLELQGDGMEFASEMIIKATLKQLKVSEVPTQLFPDGRSRPPHLRPWRDGWRHLRLLLLFSPRWLFFYPGIALLSFGFLLMILLSFGPIQIGEINLDIHSLLFSSFFMIIGVQAISFAYFANHIAYQRLHLDQPLIPMTALIQRIKLEHALLVGVMFIILGLCGAFYTVFSWAQQSFGPLLPSQMMRILIPSVTAMILGCQITLTSFFRNLLYMHAVDDLNGAK